MNAYIQAFLTALVEGLTEFVPVSSTGHMILFGDLIGFRGDKAETFTVFIQLGAILAAALIYQDRFLGLIPKAGQEPFFKRLFWGQSRPTAVHFILAVLPILVAGLLLHQIIKEQLFSVQVVAYGLIVGGVLMILAEKWPKKFVAERVDQITPKQALIVGLGQCMAIWPGMSRSGSTMITSLMIGIRHQAAAEFSFIIAVPVMVAAVSYDLYKSWGFLEASDAGYFALGFVVAFGVAWGSIRWFLRVLGKVGLIPFGIYRILLGGLVLFLIA
ncbi:MAG: undecaprenyl-diphosphate phosphatase [bacterium]|nr:undecaprenyl-diphosphate phosphatase [bacterium]